MENSSASRRRHTRHTPSTAFTEKRTLYAPTTEFHRLLVVPKPCASCPKTLRTSCSTNPRGPRKPEETPEVRTRSSSRQLLYQSTVPGDTDVCQGTRHVQELDTDRSRQRERLQLDRERRFQLKDIKTGSAFCTASEQRGQGMDQLYWKRK